jgi:hypothetical protein
MENNPAAANLAANIWAVPNYLPYVQPPLTDEMVRTAEAAIGHHLPAAYVQLLKQQNGGYIRLRLPECVHDTICGIGPRFPHLEPPDWSEVRERVSFSLDGLVPFDGDGHWHVCFDYRDDATSPKITYVDLECDREQQIASDFEGYLALLKPEVNEGDFMILGGDTLDTVVEDLALLLKVPFENLGCNDHGYPIYRAILVQASRKTLPELIFISSNLVPRGFVRTDHDEFEALKGGITGTALRYPELPESCLLLNITEASAQKIAAALKEAGFDIRPLKAFLKV